jgi:hypothetical protein
MSQIDTSQSYKHVHFPRLQQHLTQHNILISKEHDFHDNDSIETATFKLSQSYYHAWNKDFKTKLFCDLTKAFDFVNHGLFTF